MGIGTSMPTKPLDIVGDLNISGILSASSISGTINSLVSGVSSANNVILETTGATNNLSIKTNNQTRMLFNYDGNIGIGTLNPQSLLHLHSNLNSNVGILFTDCNLASSNGIIIMKDSNQNLIIRNLADAKTGGNIIMDVRTTPNAFVISSNGMIGIGTTKPMAKLDIRDGYLILPDNLGKIGIGTTNPQSLLHLNSSTGANVNIQFTDVNTGIASTDGVLMGKDSSGNAYIVNQESTGGIRLATNNVDRITVVSGGNVGIGTTIRQALLHINQPT